MVRTNGILMMLVVLLMCLLQFVVSIPICSEESLIGRSVTLTGKHGGGTDCSCTLQVSSSDQFAINEISFVQMKTPSGCQYGLRFELGNLERLYSCSGHGNVFYSLYNNDRMTLSIVTGSTSSGGFDFGFNITSSKAGSELTLTCSQTPPDPTASTVTANPTTSASQTTTTTTSTTTSSEQSTSSSSSGNSQTTTSGDESTASGGGTSASGGGTTDSGGGITTSENKPPTPKPSISGNTDDPTVILGTTQDAPPETPGSTPVSTATIIGATLGVILLFVVLVVILMCVWKKKLNANKVGAS